MHDGISLISLFSRLRACTTVSLLCGELARAVSELAGNCRVGVYLLDGTKENLHLYGAFPAVTGETSPVSVATLQDPLCFCLQTGVHYRASLAPTQSMENAGIAGGAVLAVPLTGSVNKVIGGVLIAEKETAVEEAILAVCDYGSAVLDSMLQRDRGRTLVRTLQEDLTHLQKHKKQVQAIAHDTIIGTSLAISRVRSLVVKAGTADAAVLITGETGTGKELVATAVHSLSLRSKAPFVKINCGAMPAQLLESELFGHVKGAFTGANRDTPGLLRSASGGSVLLDEVGDMPLKLQVKILRFLQDREVRPVGGVQSSRVDVRIIAATNKDLHEAMEQGTFRSDLYHRLATFHIAIPPLRERPEDIVPLVHHYLQQLCIRHNREGLALNPGSMMALCAQPYHGNVRELANMLERAILMADVTSSELTIEEANPEGRTVSQFTLAALMSSYESQIIDQTIRSCRGNLSKAAAVLGVPRSTLRSKLQKSENAEQ